MFFERVFDTSLAQASYMVGCQESGTAAVIDPKRDIRPYLEIAQRQDLRIAYVLETHIHADFLCGSRELAQKTGAELMLSGEGGEDWRYRFDHTPLRNGDEIAVGNVKLQVIHTPGHTPEHISFLLFDLASSEHPRMLFTGDFVFVGDLGRPDLLEAAAGVKGSRQVGARQMYESVQRLAELPDYIEIWPGHGAGSACGKSLGAIPSTTLGYERVASWAFSHDDPERFTAELLEGQPDPPRYFGKMKELNRARPADSVRPDPELVPQLTGTEAEQVLGWIESPDTGPQLIDTRPSGEFRKLHVAGALNLPLDPDLTNWAGWLLDYDRPIVVIDSPERAQQVQTMLASIGLDNLIGYVEPEDALRLAPTSTGLSAPLNHARRMITEESVPVLDVRSREEHEEGHIPGAIHCYLGRLPNVLTESQSRGSVAIGDSILKPDSPVIVHCRSGYRSAAASSILSARGFTSVYDLSDGFSGWEEAGLPVER